MFAAGGSLVNSPMPVPKMTSWPQPIYIKGVPLLAILETSSTMKDKGKSAYALDFSSLQTHYTDAVHD